MEKLKKELETVHHNKGFAEAIHLYIKNKCIKEDYKARVELEEKNLGECLSYLMGEVKKIAQDAQMVAATDDEVFRIVDDYYFKTKEELDITPAPPVKVEYARVDAPPAVDKPKEDKKSILTKKTPVERDPGVDNQVTLFDLLG